jgi:hypothetical protein
MPEIAQSSLKIASENRHIHGFRAPVEWARAAAVQFGTQTSVR